MKIKMLSLNTSTKSSILRTPTAGSNIVPSERLVASVYLVVLFLAHAILVRVFNMVELFRADAIDLSPFGPPFSIPFILGEELLIGCIFAVILFFSWGFRPARYIWVGMFFLYLLYLALDHLAFKHFFTHLDYILYSETHDLKNLSSSIKDGMNLSFMALVAAAVIGAVALFVPMKPGFVTIAAKQISKRRLQIILAVLAYLVVTIVLVAIEEQHGLDRPAPVAFIESYLYAEAEDAELEKVDPNFILPAATTKSSVSSDDTAEDLKGLAAVRASVANNQEKLNVVWILLESTSYRESSLVKDPKYDTTPYLAKLAGQSLLFSNYYCIVAASTRSYFSALTGVYPYMDRAADVSKYSQLKIPSLPDVLKEEGYSTAFFASSDTLFEGLDSFVSARKFDQYIDKNMIKSSEGGKTDYWGVDEEVMVDKALNWIKENKDSGHPFYVSYNALYPHHPFKVPTQHKHLYKEDWGEPLSRARFRASLRYADWAVKRFHDGLKELGVADNTLFIVTPDHGETFGDLHKKNYIHAEYSYEEDSHIFLIMHNPKVLGPSLESKRLGSHLDLFPTILHVLGIDKDLDIDGRSLISDDFEEQMMFHFSRRQLAVRDGDYKLLVSRGKAGGRPELYNLREDPTEQNNLARKEPDKTKHYRALTKQWQASVAAKFKERKKGSGLTPREVSDIVNKKREKMFAGSRVMFDSVSVCSGAGNTSCGTLRGAKVFPHGKPLSVHAKLRKYSNAKIKVEIYNKRGKRIYTELKEVVDGTTASFPSISTIDLEPEKQYRMRISSVYYYALHDSRFVPFKLSE